LSRVDVELPASGLRLGGAVVLPAGDGPFPALIFLHGSGPATREDWVDEATALAASGIATLAYDKPGCGSSEGDWTAQSFEDRAQEALIALTFLRTQPKIDAAHVGVLGMSQGGWIGPMAAAMSDDVAFVIALSASGTGPRTQDLFRLERQLQSEGFSDAEIEAALTAWRERDERFRRKESVEELVATERVFADERWYPYFAFEESAVLEFIQRIWEFEPLPYFEQCRCPLLAVWGEDDVIVAAHESRAIFARALKRAGNDSFELLLLPGLGHGLGAEDGGRMLPSVLELITEWIQNVGSETASSTAR
jgi:pimeloyl-ACP methyl ester carboxylesterase